MRRPELETEEETESETESETETETESKTETELETEIAKLAVSMVPNIDKIRFVNSGTEACMSAI